MTGNLSMRGTITGSIAKEFKRGWPVSLIDGFLEKGARVRIANEQPPVLDPDIIVENNFGRGVRVNDKSVPVESDRGQAHRVECGGRGSRRSARSGDSRDLDQTPGEGGENDALPRHEDS